MHFTYFCNNLNESAVLYKVVSDSNKSKKPNYEHAGTNYSSVLNLESINDQNAGIDVFDRGLNYGDGTFTTMMINSQSGIFCFDEHLARLELSCKTLLIDVDLQLIKQSVLSICKRFVLAENKDSLFILKVLITRGVGGRGYMPSETNSPNVIFSLTRHTKNSLLIPLESEQMEVSLASIKLAHQPKLAGLKHTNRLEQVLAKLELKSLRVQDLLLTCQDNCIIEATSSNLFLSKNGKWYTPRLNKCGVSGVMRNAFINFLESRGDMVEEIDVTVNQLANFDSLFTCNALNPMVPINKVYIQQGKEDLEFDIRPTLSLFSEFIQFLKELKTTEW